MDVFVGLMLLALGGYTVKTLEERQRIELLAGVLRPYQLEQLMARLLEGYLKALGHSDPDRRNEALQALGNVETQLAERLQAFSADLSKVWGEKVRVSRLPIGIPFATRMFPALSFDLRALVALHAQAVAAAVHNDAGLGRRDQAFRLSAEMLLFQHSCHWYCRSITLASARLLARHQTSHAQVLDAVAPETRQAYLKLVRR
ncbi:MAG: hypothetical protein R3E99_12045 [Burkholderiaceae bacterium]